ncbi:MAG: hypothetical protein AAGN82_00460 [Myxococcota bacterium]
MVAASPVVSPSAATVVAGDAHLAALEGCFAATLLVARGLRFQDFATGGAATEPILNALRSGDDVLLSFGAGDIVDVYDAACRGEAEPRVAALVAAAEDLFAAPRGSVRWLLFPVPPSGDEARDEALAMAGGRIYADLGFRAEAAGWRVDDRFGVRDLTRRRSWADACRGLAAFRAPARPAPIDPDLAIRVVPIEPHRWPRPPAPVPERRGPS